MGALLTIAIPTYNRLEKLKTCLDEILVQAQNKSIEILVSDNCSSDGTEQLMMDVKQEHPEISYTRNSENIGPDRNFLNCYSQAKGEYVLLIGDDDLLLPGAIDSILAELIGKPSFVHLNSCSLVSNDPLIYSAPRMLEGETRKYTDINKAFREIGIFITFLSSLILKTDSVRAIVDKEKYIGTYFLQSHIAFHSIATEGLYVIITKNCIAAEGNYMVNYDLFNVWGEQYYDLLFETAVTCGVNEDVLNDIYYTNLKTTIFGFVLSFRQTCPNERNWNKTLLMNCVKKYPDLINRFRIAVYCPRVFLKPAMKSYRYMKNIFSNIFARSD